MPLTLNEAETAAYQDPSQENLAVYVKLLEEALVEAGDQAAEVTRLEELLEELPSQKEWLNLCNRAQTVIDSWGTDDLAAAIRKLEAAL